MAKTLIAYFSRADENYFAGAMRYVKIGLPITGSNAGSSEGNVKRWLTANGLL